MQKKILTTILIIFTFIFFYFISAFYSIFIKSLVKKNAPTSIKVYPAQSASTVTENLYQQKLISHPALFHWLIHVTGSRYDLRYGEYQIQYPLTAWQLLHHMVEGTGLVKHRLTIVNGWTFDQIRNAISAESNLNQTIATETSQTILQKLNAPYKHIEGLFYPDTYFFTWGNSDISVLKTAYQKMQTTLQNDWENRASNVPYQNMYQALIVASLIEKETSVDAEKPMIASVIINRLHDHMPLQIDSSVQYGVDKMFGGELTKTELATKTPYNTYLSKGLPPTPICVPSQSSIVAALHPAKTDYLYYVATGTGGHNFSKTYKEHLEQVKAYRKIVNN